MRVEDLPHAQRLRPRLDPARLLPQLVHRVGRALVRAREVGRQLWRACKLQVTSYKLRVTSYELQLQAASYEVQAASYELRATSYVACRL